jgi:hypothetical protein
MLLQNSVFNAGEHPLSDPVPADIDYTEFTVEVDSGNANLGIVCGLNNRKDGLSKKEKDDINDEIALLGDNVANVWNKPRHHYDNLGFSMLTNFQIMTGENWPSVS